MINNNYVDCMNAAHFPDGIFFKNILKLDLKNGKMPLERSKNKTIMAIMLVESFVFEKSLRIFTRTMICFVCRWEVS